MKKFTVEIQSNGAELQDCATEQEAEALIDQFERNDIVEFGESCGEGYYAIRVTDGDNVYMTTDLRHISEVTA